jgi:serine phosphatase RsbU (regulator of sigma subunit)/Tfp pilus assembly protein PilF
MLRKISFLLILIYVTSTFGQNKVLDSLELALKKPQTDSSYIKIYLEMSYQYIELRNHKKCDELFELSMKKAIHSKRPKLQGQVLNNRGNYQNTLGNTAQAQLLFIEAINKYRTVNHFKGMASSYSNLAISYAYQKDFKTALKNLMLSLENLEKYDYKPIAKADTYINVGSVYISLNEREKGKKYLIDAKTIYESLKNLEGISYCLNNLGSLCFEEKQFVKAKSYFEEALATKLKSNSPNNQILSTYIDLAECENAMGNVKTAHETSLKALTIADTSAYNNTLKNLYYSLSNGYEHFNDLSKALYFHKLYLKVSRKLDQEMSNDEAIKKAAELEYTTKSIADSINFASKQSIQDAKVRADKWQKYALYGGLLVAICVGAFVYNRLRITKNQNAIIQEQKSEVEEKNKQIIDSINYAQRIQKSLLASNEILTTYLPQHFIFFEPKDIVSGDFYWTTVTENFFYFAVCDSTGHGVPGAFMSLLNMSFLNEAVIEKKISQPNEILNYVRKRLLESLPNGQDGMDATLFQFPISKEKNTIDFSQKIYYSAANNEPVLVRQNILEKLEKDSMAVGKSYSESSFANFEIQLEKGDKLYLYTDGFADQFGGDRGKKYKSAHLNQLLEINSKEEISFQLSTLDNGFQNWKGAQDQVDDVCVFGMLI